MNSDAEQINSYFMHREPEELKHIYTMYLRWATTERLRSGRITYQYTLNEIRAVAALRDIELPT